MGMWTPETEIEEKVARLEVLDLFQLRMVMEESNSFV